MQGYAKINRMTIDVVFMGSPDFALPVLRRLAETYRVVGVVTQPDRPAGRGRTMTPPPVKSLAETLGIAVIQPRRLREPEAFAQLQAWQPQLIVVAAFGQILRQNVLDLPPYGCINVHASLLPRWRGAAPIQAAILAGDAQSGVTIMQMDAGVDTGPQLNRRAVPILPEDTAETLSGRLATAGADLLIETLPAYLAGSLSPEPQQTQDATYAPMLKKEDGLLNFDEAAAALERRVRAFSPWPGAYLIWQGEALKVHRAHVADHDARPAGRRLVVQGCPALATAAGVLVLDEVQPAGKKAMPGKVFLNGARQWAEGQD